MSPIRRVAPVWLMGLANSTFGMYAGFVGILLPHLLSMQNLPESRITSITAWVFWPWCWIFLLSPMLDVHFSRRFYATVLAAIAGVAVAVGLLNLHRLVILQGALMTGSAASFLSGSAPGDCGHRRRTLAPPVAGGFGATIGDADISADMHLSPDPGPRP